MRATEPAICEGAVVHRRVGPSRHAFRYPVRYVWIDPDDPEALCDLHPLWSAHRMAPIRFRRGDYGTHSNGSLREGVRDDLAGVLDRRPTGEVRMLTQLRRWGWLFNPITVYVAWDSNPDEPVGCVLEVTNTPWKQRHRYAVRLDTGPEGWMTATTSKVLHVSPFLDEDFDYRLRLRADGGQIELGIDVVESDIGATRLQTELVVSQRTGTRRLLSRELWLGGLPTHRVSAGIHRQALALWRKGVAVVPHPAKRVSVSRHSSAEPNRLLTRARATRTTSALQRRTTALSSRIVAALLTRFRSDRLIVADETAEPRIREFGPGGGITATVRVVDRRAYSAVLAEGSAGFGRGFIEGWWTSDDPVAVTRVIIRNLAGLDRMRNRWRRTTGWATDRYRRMRPRDSRRRNRDDIASHYDIGNEFFELFLDETMLYSSAVFPSLDTELADASRHKCDLLLDRLGVEPGQHLLEIGTGWGGLAIHAASRGCEVTTTTISSEQLREARKRVADHGFTDRITLLDLDWRDLTGRFDHVVSVEMIEAVDWRDYDDFFATIERRLAPGGRVAIQAIVLPDNRWERAKNTVDFIRRFVFPNGYLPSLGAIERSLARATNLRIDSVDDFGPHYAETLRRWRERFEARIDDVAALGLDDRFQRLWRFYVSYCEAGFRERHCSVVQIVLTARTDEV